MFDSFHFNFFVAVINLNPFPTNNDPKKAFVDCVDRDQTAQNVQSDL